MRLIYRYKMADNCGLAHRLAFENSRLKWKLLILLIFKETLDNVANVLGMVGNGNDKHWSMMS